MAINKHSYKIAYVGLKVGLHRFYYTLDNAFFELFSQSPIKEANIKIELLFDKKNSFFELIFKLDGWVNTLCDRCNEDYELEIIDDHNLFVKFESFHRDNNSGEDVIYLNKNETHLDITQYLYEFSVLSLPIKKSCKLNKDATPKCGKDLNKYFSDDIDIVEKPTIDPRWEALKKLNN